MCGSWYFPHIVKETNNPFAFCSFGKLNSLFFCLFVFKSPTLVFRTKLIVNTIITLNCLEYHYSFLYESKFDSE